MTALILNGMVVDRPGRTTLKATLCSSVFTAIVC